MTTHSHHDNVEKQFGSQANAYLTSAVHATGRDLQRLAERLSAFPHASVLDMGCGAGHASFIAAQNVKQVVAYDLSSQMLDVVAQAAKEKGLANITTRQGYAESLPFEDAVFDVVISRYSAHHWHDVGRALREVNRVLKPGRCPDYYGCHVPRASGPRYLVTDGGGIARHLARSQLFQRRMAGADE
ncbi:methyltransferase [Citrobacter amalonaticus]|nr:methyltransferase [Citrobacter amalonaticus]